MQYRIKTENEEFVYDAGSKWEALNLFWLDRCGRPLDESVSDVSERLQKGKDHVLYTLTNRYSIKGEER